MLVLVLASRAVTVGFMSVETFNLEDVKIVCNRYAAATTGNTRYKISESVTNPRIWPLLKVLQAYIDPQWVRSIQVYAKRVIILGHPDV